MTLNQSVFLNLLQVESLSDFYEVCKGLELARNFQFPVLRASTIVSCNYGRVYRRNTTDGICPGRDTEEDIEPAEDTNSSVDEAKPEPMDDFNVSNDDPAPPPPPPPPTFNSQDPDDLLGGGLDSLTPFLISWVSYMIALLLLRSNNVADNLGALRANDELLDLRLGDSGTKLSKFSNYIRIVFD
ncbi:hypothetical protein Tco_1359156, partial [Tanacetum coccineum]